MVSVDRQFTSPNFNARRGGAAIDMAVLHYTDMPVCAEAIARLCDPMAEVSAHYVIRQDGKIFALVDEAMRAWHAGVSRWQGAENINDRSIGIELDHDPKLGLWYPEPQITALIALLRDIFTRHAIPLTRVLGHDDVAPTRKIDPGKHFPWQKLIDARVAERTL